MNIQWVLITGATQGIGYEFARQFAAAGWQMVFVARDEARLREVADELSARHGVTIKTMVKDLSYSTAAQEIFDELQREQIVISILVNNAGFGVHGPFAEVELSRHLNLLQTNVASLVQLTHLFVKPMLARRAGRILNVASVAAFMPGPFMAMYYASKAFVHSFSCALAEELSGTGVTVTSVCPGVTASQFHARSGLNRDSMLHRMSAEQVAKIGYRALMKGKPIVITGSINKLGVLIVKAAPIRLVTRMAAKVNR
jgi:short-subunit dehydrogenase